MSKIIVEAMVVCPNCLRSFLMRQWKINQGRKFCSRKCFVEYSRPALRERAIKLNEKKREYRSCLECKNIFPIRISALRRKGRGKFCSKKCFDSWLRQHPKLKDNNPNWRGGKSFEKYPEEYNFYLRKKIRDRDNQSCKICGIKKGDLVHGRLIVHHIDYNKNNNMPHNLITLCSSCHGNTNFKREEWFDRLCTENFHCSS